MARARYVESETAIGDDGPYTVTSKPLSIDSSDMVINVSIPSTSPSGLLVIHRTFLDRLLERLGIAKKIQTGDAWFDSSFTIESETPEWAAAVMNSRSARTAAQDLLESGFQEVLRATDTCSAGWTGHRNSLAPFVSPSEAAHLLAELAAPAPFPSQTELADTDNSRRALFWLPPAFALQALVSTLILEQGPTVTSSSLSDHWCKPAMIGFAVYMMLTLWLNAGHSTARRNLVLALVMGGIFGPIGSCVIAEGINSGLDTSPKRAYSATVSSKDGRGIGAGTVFFSRVNDPSQIEIFVEARLHDLIEPLDPVEFVTRPGFLGEEWIESVRTPFGEAFPSREWGFMSYCLRLSDAPSHTP